MAIYNVVAWRLLYTTYVARVARATVLEDDEWKALYVVDRRLIAMLGGLMGRRRDGEPGVQSLWTGFADSRNSPSRYNDCVSPPPVGKG
jgi:hypothetical protein